MKAGVEEVGFAALTATLDKTYCMDAILSGNEVAFGECGIDDGVLQRGDDVRLDYTQHEGNSP